MTKMTDRKIYENIAKGALDLTDEIKAWAEKKIAQLDHKAEKAKERAAEKRAEGDALREAVLAAVGDEFETIGDIASRIEGADVSAAKVAYRLNALAKEENGALVEKGEIVVKNEDGKGSRRLVAYKRA